MVPIPNISYSSVRSHRGACFHAARSVAQADLFELEWAGRPGLLKDFSGRPWLVRLVWSRAIAAREVRALRRLQGVPGMPKLYATAGPEAFIIERLDATRLPRKNEKPPAPEFWTGARALLERLHARGIGHGDLRRKNILIGPENQAYFIDFATAVIRGNGRGAWLKDFIFHRYRLVDRVTFARIKASYRSARLDPEEKKWLAGEPWYLRVGRVLKRRVYRLRKGSWWRDRRRKLSRWLRRKFNNR